MGDRILYFYKRENAFYRDKKRTNLLMEEKDAGDSLKLFYCGLPEYYKRRSKWSVEKLFGLMQSCCEYVSADSCYLEEGFEKELAEAGIRLTSGGQRMCGGLIRKTAAQLQGIDGILYLEGGFGKRMELPLPDGMLRKLRCFFYLGEKSEQYEVLEENLWQEYGMPLLSAKGADDLAACRIRRLLVLDDRREGKADRKMLPERCVYLDLWSDAERRAQMEKDRKGIKYISEYVYLSRHFEGIK